MSQDPQTRLRSNLTAQAEYAAALVRDHDAVCIRCSSFRDPSRSGCDRRRQLVRAHKARQALVDRLERLHQAR